MGACFIVPGGALLLALLACVLLDDSKRQPKTRRDVRLMRGDRKHTPPMSYRKAIVCWLVR
jgi:hypothetical protein